MVWQVQHNYLFGDFCFAYLPCVANSSNAAHLIEVKIYYMAYCKEK